MNRTFQIKKKSSKHLELEHPQYIYVHSIPSTTLSIWDFSLVVPILFFIFLILIQGPKINSKVNNTEIFIKLVEETTDNKIEKIPVITKIEPVKNISENTTSQPVVSEKTVAVFGISEGEASEDGEFSVAIGNTLMKTMDSIVTTKPIQPLSSSPIKLDRRPAVISFINPIYPESAEEQGLESTVVLTLTINEKGVVTDIEVTTSGGKDFDASAIEAAKKTKFQPLIKEGRAIKAKFEIDYNFVL